MTYGFEVKDENSPYLEATEKVVHGISEVSVPGQFLVEAIPWSRFPS